MLDEPGENTVSMVNHMLQRRRSLRLWIFAGTAVALAFLGFMVLHLGSPDKNVQVDGPVYAPHATWHEDAVAPAPAPTNKNIGTASKPAAVADTRVPVEVEVDLRLKRSQLWADGRLIGTEPHQILNLQPGKHTLMVRSPSGIQIQKLMINPDDQGFHVDFNTKVKVTRTLP